MNEQGERGRRLRVGIFILVGLLVFLGTIYMLGARARLFEPRYTVHAEFTEVGGLSEGATVRLAGVQIGRVSDVRLPAEPGGKVQVALTVARQYADRVRKNSVARIETQGLLGDKIVEITVGTSQAPPTEPGDTIAARDPFDISRVVSESAQTVRNVTALVESLRVTAETFSQSRVVEDIAATARAARQLTEQVGREVASTASATRQVVDRVGRVVDQVEQGKGWAHALLYEEPRELRRLNDLLVSTQAVLDRVNRGEGAIGVLMSPRSGAAAQRLLGALDRFGRAAERPGEAGLLPALLLDPKYRSTLDDLTLMVRNFREVSDRLAGGRGTLGSLLRDTPGDGAGLGQASQDLQVTLANLRAITEKVNQGQGTLGGLIVDPTVYDRLVAVLEGAQRSVILRSLIRGLGDDDGKTSGRRPGGADRKR
jgi:phospholipid/cholesterol/gamma-HCH transport system substrate-binding protein